MLNNPPVPPTASSALPANSPSADTGPISSCSNRQQNDFDLLPHEQVLPSTLHNGRPPVWEVGHENFAHRQMAYLVAQGLSHREIAQETGYTTVTIGNLCRQPWFQEKVTEIQDKLGIDSVKGLLSGALKDCIWTLINLRDDDKTPPAVRANVSNSLIDRVLGKPTQHVEVASAPSVKDVAAYDQEIKTLQEQLGNLSKQSQN